MKPLMVVTSMNLIGICTIKSCRAAHSQAKSNFRQDKTRITPVPASQADEVSDLILVRSRLAHA